MGYYTSFKFNATLKKDVPDELLDFIKSRLTEGEHAKAVAFDDHPFFNHDRWSWILTWRDSNGVDHEPSCSDTPDGLVIHIDTELKNYESEIEWFLIWIAPMVNLEHPCDMLQKGEDEYDEDKKDCSDLIERIQTSIKLNAAYSPALLLENDDFMDLSM